MTEVRIHPETGQPLRRETRVQTLSVGAQVRHVDVPGWYPGDDGDSLHSGSDLKALDQAYLELRAAYAQAAGSNRQPEADASDRAQEDCDLDPRIIVMSPASFDEFSAALDAPQVPNERLIKTLQTRAPWEID